MSGKRITIVASEVLGVPGTGGPGTADSLLAVALGRHGHRVELLVAPGREFGDFSDEWARTYESAHVHVRALRYTRNVEPPFLRATAEILDALMADPPDVVIADEWRGSAFAALQARRTDVGLTETAFVSYCHAPGRALTGSARKVPDTVARFGEDVAERSCIEFADAVVSPSAWLLRWMRDHRWPLDDSAHVIPYLWQSVALGEAAPQAARDVPVRRLAFFGQLREGKGIRVYISALRRLDPDLLGGTELLFLGRETPRWTAESVREALGAVVADRVSSLRFESGLDRSAALRELLIPGTLAVMPSLVDNSPYAVAECLEHGIPFVGADVGGVGELIAQSDHGRVLCAPTAEDLAAKLDAALASKQGFAPAEAARPGPAALEAWLALLESISPSREVGATPPTRVTVVALSERAVERAKGLADRTRTTEVDVVHAKSRHAGIEEASAEWVVFLDDDDEPDDELVDALVTAQARAGADLVTSAVRADGGMRMFLGDPGSLGLVENHYGVIGLVRRSLAAQHVVDDAVVDPDWPLFARVVLSGAHAVALPVALSAHSGSPGTVGDVPGDGLLVLEAFEAHKAAPLHDLPQLTATIAAALQHRDSRGTTPDTRPSGVQRLAGVLLREGPAGVGRRLRARRR